MSEQQGGGGGGSSTTRRSRGTTSRHGGMATPELEAAVPTGPCGACKFLRRKCTSECIFAPYFDSDQGPARFASVHKVFGASNVSKFLLNIPVNRRDEAVATICYEAQARISDPVYGCVPTILTLQQQVASLQEQLTMLQTQLIHGSFAYPSVLHSTQQQQHTDVGLQSAYPNNFNPGFDFAVETGPSSHSLESLQFSQLPQYEEEDEDKSKIPQIFNHDIVFHRH